MAICPEHGAYLTEQGCRKCGPAQYDKRLGPVPPVDPELKEKLSVGPPKLDEADKLALTRLENASLKSFHAMQNAQAQFQNFAKAMFEKYSVKPAEYTLDMEKLEFVLRGM